MMKAYEAYSLSQKFNHNPFKTEKARDKLVLKMVEWAEYVIINLAKKGKREAFLFFLSDFSWTSSEKVRNCFPSVVDILRDNGYIVEIDIDVATCLTAKW